MSESTREIPQIIEWVKIVLMSELLIPVPSMIEKSKKIHVSRLVAELRWRNEPYECDWRRTKQAHVSDIHCQGYVSFPALPEVRSYGVPSSDIGFAQLGQKEIISASIKAQDA